MSRPILPHGDKTPITQVGQPCRHCQTPVILKVRGPSKKWKPGSFYYASWLKCPNRKCRAIYFLESEKRWDGAKPEGDAFDSFSAAAFTAPPITPAVAPPAVSAESFTELLTKKERKRLNREAKRERKREARRARKIQREAAHVNQKQKYWDEYRAYINSIEWRAFRAGLIAARGSQCEECGQPGSVDGHHLTYKRFRHELPEDVKLLCRKCHEAKHPNKPQMKYAQNSL
jgi:5-methylcytosine-specific restriction endonuclease McrA